MFFTVSISCAKPLFHFDTCDWLLVSNRPETIRAPGILFEDRIYPLKKTRLFYSHINKSGSPVVLEVKLINNNSRPVEILVSNSWAGPGIKPIIVGHEATLEFLRHFSSQSKSRLRILPHSQVSILEETLPHYKSISGMAQLEVVGDHDLKLTAIVEASISSDKLKTKQPEHLYNKHLFNPFMVHPRGVFVNPDIYLEATYIAGKGQTQTEIGNPPWLIDKFTGEPNVGNYGALYFITFYLNNLTDLPHNVELYMTSLNCPAMGSFLINNDIISIPITRLYEESLIVSIILAPQEKRILKIITLPEAGSCYPVRITARPQKVKPEKYIPEEKDVSKNNS